MRGTNVAVGIACGLFLALAGCGGASGGGESSGPNDTATKGSTGASGTKKSAAPLSNDECKLFLEHVIVLMVAEHNVALREAHGAKQAKLADDAKSKGQPAPKPEPFDERMLWTPADAKKARGEFSDQYVKECLKMSRATVECAMGAKSADEMRRC